MWKVLLGLLKGGSGRKSVAGNLAWEIREAIKGKELDPEKLIELQTKINMVEASHRTLFVAGWRPAVGWVNVIGMASNYILIPMGNFALAVAGSEITIPLLQMSEMMPVLLGMLGLGGMRTVEKIQKVSREK